jgi:outer membrane protein assembly factor BamB
MRALARASEGPVYVGGAYFDGARQRPFVVALDAASGARAWSVFDPSGTASDGNEGTEVIVVGGGGDGFVARAAEGISRRAAATGAELWRSSATDALVVPPDGDLRSVLSVVLPPPLPGLPTLYTASTQRLAAVNGAIVWSDTLNLGGEFGGFLVRLEARDIATSANGTSFSLSARPFASDPDGLVVANAADGTRLWAANYTAGLAGRNDDPFAIAAGPDGDPVVAGRTDM